MNLVLCSDIQVWERKLCSGGTAVHIYELSRALAKLGHHVTILQPSHLRWKDILGEGLTVIGIPSLRAKGIHTLYYSARLRTEIQRLISEGLVDVVQFHNITGLASYLSIEKLVVPTITKCHGVPDFYIKNFRLSGNVDVDSYLFDSIFSKNVNKLCYRLSPHIISNSLYTKKSLVHCYGVSPEKITVIYNGVNNELFNPKVNAEHIRDRLGLRDNTILLFVGDFSFLKGVYHLIAAFKKVAEKRRDVYLLLIGGYHNRQYAMLSKLIMQTNLQDRIKVVGFLPYVELPYWYAAADFCIFPSLFESFGNAALEAMACGKPLVTFGTGGLAEIVNDEVGIIVKWADIQALAQAILTLADNESLRKELGKKAADHSKKFSWDLCAEQTISVFKRLRN